VIAAIALGLSLVAAQNDAAAYLDQIERRIMVAWRLPTGAEGLKVSLRFNLARNGHVSKVRVEKSSGNAKFDGSAVEAVRRASPLPRPPRSFPVGDLRIVLEPTALDRHTDDGQAI
jgi:TonB family protein